MSDKPLPEWAKEPILPYQSSDLERDLDIAISHIESVEIPIRDLWNPWKCPLVALPYLAWAVKVSHWEHDWSEKIKRQVVADSLDVHRIRGTRPAVEKALLSLDVRCELLEWFERPELGMKPGHFRVTAYASADINPIFTEQIREAVNQAKPISRPFTLSVQGMLKANYGAAAVLRTVQLKRLRLESN